MIGLVGLSAGVVRKKTTGGFLIPMENLNKLALNMILLTSKQAQHFMSDLQSGKGMHIRPTKQQEGGFLGTLLASIGIPFALNVIKGLTDKGALRIGAPKLKGGNGHQLIQRPNPFIGTWDQM